MNLSNLYQFSKQTMIITWCLAAFWTLGFVTAIGSGPSAMGMRVIPFIVFVFITLAHATIFAAISIMLGQFSQKQVALTRVASPVVQVPSPTRTSSRKSPVKKKAAKKIRKR